MFDLDHPFFNPLWRRIAVTAVCLGWGGVEAWSGNAFWALLFVALGVYCLWSFFIAWKGPFEPRS